MVLGHYYLLEKPAVESDYCDPESKTMFKNTGILGPFSVLIPCVFLLLWFSSSALA